MKARHFVLGCALLVSCVFAEAAPIDDAKSFWLDFDTQTFKQKGEQIDQVYGVTDPTDAGQLAAAKAKAGKDIFDGFGSAANLAIGNEALEANGKAVPAARIAAVADAYKKLKDDGAMQRLSTLQLSIIKKHFNTGGNIDFAKFQTAMEFFANGELRDAGREMDQFHQWFARTAQEQQEQGQVSHLSFHILMKRLTV